MEPVQVSREPRLGGYYSQGHRRNALATETWSYSESVDRNGQSEGVVMEMRGAWGRDPGAELRHEGRDAGWSTREQEPLKELGWLVTIHFPHSGALQCWLS